ncbi:MAG: membrane protein insertion efficiency factor YidD [bacterium]
MTQALIPLIRIYQKTISPDHGWFKYRHPYGFCKYYPTCSEYSKQALSRFGPRKGILLAIKRLIKCHPLAQSRVDLVPIKK